MPLKTVVHRLFVNGRQLLRNIRDRYQKVLKRSEVLENRETPVVRVEVEARSEQLGRKWPIVGHQFPFQAQVRHLFVNSILKRVTNTLAAELRRKAAKRLLFAGDAVPFLSLVGVSLASGSGIITKEDEMEGICWEIREATSRLRSVSDKLMWSSSVKDISSEDVEDHQQERGLCLQDLQLGQRIAQGCNAVVYTARWSKGCHSSAGTEDSNDSQEGETAEEEEPEPSTESKDNYPLAVKMMFNYDAESNAPAILKAMYRETVPAQYSEASDIMLQWESRLHMRKKHLPPHPNIVDMFCVFSDQVVPLPDMHFYSAALPRRLHPDGEGRNMSLFLVMKRYDCNLEEYLSQGAPPTRTSMLLLTQLLEGVAHMSRCGIAHRDLKCDNLLLDLKDGDICPHLVITDFGCCLADRYLGLRLPYHTVDTDRGGNWALMAPEVACAEPGPFTSISHEKSDAWTVGTIAYQIFGETNPFYKKEGQQWLDTQRYVWSQLPRLPHRVPPIIRAVIADLLQRSPAQRLSANMAATICQLFLWAPSSWIHSVKSSLPSSAEVLQWLLCMTTKVVCETRFPGHSCISGSGHAQEYQLILTFLSRVQLSQIITALKWIQDV